MQRNRHHVIGNAQRATGNKRRGKDHRRHATDNGQQGTRKQGNLRHAADTAQKTVKTGSACNRQRASDSKQHARGREHMRDATGNTRYCRISGAASSVRRTTSSMREELSSTTSALHGTDATPVTHTEPTTRSRQCNAREERRDEGKPDARAPRGCVVPAPACPGVLRVLYNPHFEPASGQLARLTTRQTGPRPVDSELPRAAGRVSATGTSSAGSRIRMN